MAKATVLQCDKCQSWDSEKDPVRTVSVAGPKLELCTGCRIDLMEFMGVDRARATRYQEMMNSRKVSQGTWPALSTSDRWTPDSDPESDAPETDDTAGADQPDGDSEAVVLPFGGSEAVSEPELDLATDSADAEVKPKRGRAGAKS